MTGKNEQESAAVVPRHSAVVGWIGQVPTEHCQGPVGQGGDHREGRSVAFEPVRVTMRVRPSVYAKSPGEPANDVHPPKTRLLMRVERRSFQVPVRAEPCAPTAGSSGMRQDYAGQP